MLQRALIVMLILMLPLQGTLAMLGEMTNHDSGAGIDGTSISTHGHCCHLTVSLAPAPQPILSGNSSVCLFSSAHDDVRDFLAPETIERPDWHVTHHA